MKPILLVAIFCCISSSLFAQHSATKLWETDTILKVPESVIYDAENKILYVSNIDGTDGWAKDGKGSIAKVGLDGKVIAVEWVTGLNAPKGLGIYKGKLYAADIDEVVVIDIQKGAIEKKIPIEGAKGLNDISIGSNGADQKRPGISPCGHETRCDRVCGIVLRCRRFVDAPRSRPFHPYLHVGAANGKCGRDRHAVRIGGESQAALGGTVAFRLLFRRRRNSSDAGTWRRSLAHHKNSDSEAHLSSTKRWRIHVRCGWRLLCEDADIGRHGDRSASKSEESRFDRQDFRRR